MISIRKAAKRLGAEIDGVDLSRSLDDATFARISAAFFEHEVVVFRGQTLTPSQQIAFTRRFGDLEHHVRKEHRLEGYPEILVVSNVLDERGAAVGVQDAGRFWHSDLSYKQVPSLLSALYALEVPVEDGRALGATSFASAAAAYDALAPELKWRLQGLRNIHSYRYYRAKNLAAQKEESGRGAREVQEHPLSEDQLKSVPDVEVPIVRTHPVTGRKSLFINEAHTARIVGLPESEGATLLTELCAHIVKPEFRYEHSWRAGDLLMWDNVAVQHKANFDYDLPLRRLMHRTTVRGSVPV
ncbi:MAG TPA: TauD/TfdA family dioxygenase [Burkholderiales bacterium]|nr:TauD/TfdA family dioxygenase [Burkholderiales bacterium]